MELDDAPDGVSLLILVAASPELAFSSIFRVMMNHIYARWS